jgi:thiamine-monophosphate kinase
MIDHPSEDDLIARYFAPIAGPGGLGLRDDAALLDPPAGCEIVATVDGIVAGVHFFVDDPPESIARKALRVNLSDLAAKGATPQGFLLMLALTPDWRPEWLERFSRALGEDATLYGCPLLGGDTVSTPGPLSISITALGSVPRGQMVARTGVRADDAIYVSGTIGDAALGLAMRRAAGSVCARSEATKQSISESGEDRVDGLLCFARNDGEGCDFLVDRYLHPQPRLALVPVLRENASGGMDVSDGLVGDLTKMLRVSGVTADIDVARIPLSPAAARLTAADPSLLSVALTGGDDYEILASVPQARCAAFEAVAWSAGVPVARIGQARAGEGPPLFRNAQGEAMRFAHGSYSHF